MGIFFLESAGNGGCGTGGGGGDRGCLHACPARGVGGGG